MLTRFTTSMHITHTDRKPKEFLKWYMFRFTQKQVRGNDYNSPIHCIHIHRDRNDQVSEEEGEKIHYNEWNVIDSIRRLYD